jgi:hypothetical protein
MSYVHNPFHRPAFPYSGNKTQRREIRRNVRNWLGTSSDDAPTLETALAAADELKRIIDLASGGRYGLAVVRSIDHREGFQETPQKAWYRDELVTSSQVHEPISQTRSREKQLRDEAQLSYREYA